MRYSYAKVSQQKFLQQIKKQGKRLNIKGLYSLGVSFDYGLKLGSFKGDSEQKLMNWQAQQAAEHLANTGQITVIVQDNHPMISLQRGSSILASVATARSLSFPVTNLFFGNEPY